MDFSKFWVDLVNGLLNAKKNVTIVTLMKNSNSK